MPDDNSPATRRALAAADTAAAELHAQWQAGFRAANGPTATRPKTTTDPDWIRAHRTDTVDIAATDYHDLPEDWKGENKAAAQAVADYYTGPWAA